MRRALKPLAVLGGALLVVAAAAPTAIDLPGERLFPESVSITRDGTAYVGSMGGGVLRVRLRDGRVEPWIRPGAFGSGPLFGVFADPRNHMLWVCSNDFSARGVAVAGADGGAALKGFDLATGVGRVSLKLPGADPVCNDIAVARDGTVFVTDTAASVVLRRRPGSTALEPWSRDPALAAPQGGGLDGIAIGGDGNLILNNVRSGTLLRIVRKPDGSAGAVTRLVPSRPLVSPDGMRALGGMRFVLAEGEGRIDVVEVRGDRAEVRMLADRIVHPTGLAPYRGQAWVVQGQLSALFNPKAPQPTLPFRLTPVAIGR